MREVSLRLLLLNRKVESRNWSFSKQNRACMPVALGLRRKALKTRSSFFLQSWSPVQHSIQTNFWVIWLVHSNFSMPVARNASIACASQYPTSKKKTVLQLYAWNLARNLINQGVRVKLVVVYSWILCSNDRQAEGHESHDDDDTTVLVYY